MTDETTPTITLDGASYAVSQTAHVVYARGLKAELELLAPAESS